MDTVKTDATSRGTKEDPQNVDLHISSLGTALGSSCGHSTPFSGVFEVYNRVRMLVSLTADNPETNRCKDKTKYAGKDGFKQVFQIGKWSTSLMTSVLQVHTVCTQV